MLDLSNIPRKVYNGRDVYDWINSIGCNISFEYDDIIGVIKIIKYNNCKFIIEINNENYSISLANLTNVQLGRILNKRNNTFQIEIGITIKDNKRDFNITSRYYKDNLKLYKFTCNICGWENGEISENSLLGGQGCSCCAGRTIVNGINDIPTTAPWMVKYFQGGYDEARLYTKSSSRYIYPVCPDCGKVKDNQMRIASIYSRGSIGCECSDKISYPEKFILSLLYQLQINFIYQFSNKNKKWCDKYKYDFYINKTNTIIEVHGGGHYFKNGFVSLGGKTLGETQENDRLKNQLAKENGIKHYIVLDCRKSELKWIKNSVIESELPSLFNFTEDDVDWLKCHEFACKNFIKEVCEYKNHNPNSTSTMISKIFKLSKSTIKTYLKLGNDLSWCSYDPRKEMIRVCSINGKASGKKVKISKNGNLLGVYESAHELSRQSEKYFGISFTYQNISKACNTHKKYKGYDFQYISI